MLENTRKNKTFFIKFPLNENFNLKIICALNLCEELIIKSCCFWDHVFTPHCLGEGLMQDPSHSRWRETASGISGAGWSAPACWTGRSAPGRTWSIWEPGSPGLLCSPTAASSGSRWGRSPWHRAAPGNLERHVWSVTVWAPAHIGYNRLVQQMASMMKPQGFHTSYKNKFRFKRIII